MLRKRVKRLEEKVKAQGKTCDAQAKEINQLQCGQKDGHSYSEWKKQSFCWNLYTCVIATCSKCGHNGFFAISTLKPTRIKALLELGVLTKSDLPRPKPRKKARRS